eukprot:6132167-Pleurochrysis_carterae.AAC.1
MSMFPLGLLLVPRHVPRFKSPLLSPPSRMHVFLNFRGVKSICSFAGNPAARSKASLYLSRTCEVRARARLLHFTRPCMFPHVHALPRAVVFH